MFTGRDGAFPSPVPSLMMSGFQQVREGGVPCHRFSRVTGLRRELLTVTDLLGFPGGSVVENPPAKQMWV